MFKLRWEGVGTKEKLIEERVEEDGFYKLV